MFWNHYNELALQLWEGSANEPRTNQRIAELLLTVEDVHCVLIGPLQAVFLPCSDLAALWLLAERCVQEIRQTHWCSAWVSELRVPFSGKSALFTNPQEALATLTDLQPVPQLPLAVPFDPMKQLSIVRRSYPVLCARETGTAILCPVDGAEVPVMDLSPFRTPNLDSLEQLYPDPENEL